MTTAPILDKPDRSLSQASASRARDAKTAELLVRLADSSDPGECAELRQALVLNNLELARALAWRYAQRGVPIDDLMQVASLALVKAVRAFDPQRIDKFQSFVVPTVLGELKRHFRDVAWSVKPPRRVQELQIRIKRATSELAQELGELPTSRQLADRLEVADVDIDEAMNVHGCFSPSSLDRTVAARDDERSMGDSLAVAERGFDQSETAMLVAPLIAALSTRDRRIIYLRFYCEWTQARIAAELGVTQMQVSRILSRAMTRFRAQLGQQGLTFAS